MHPTRDLPSLCALVVLAATNPAASGAVGHPGLQAELTSLSRTVSGRVGACIADGAAPPICVNGGQRFSIQSVMKLLVGVAVMDAVDAGRWRLDDPVTVHPRDLSVCLQPLAKLVTAKGYRTTTGDLMRRAIVDSDCTAADVLIARLGGPAAVEAVLVRHGIKGVHIDRDERHLQTETEGLAWRPDYADHAALERAIAAVPKARRAAAYGAYLTDPRDTATPEGMTALLQALADGKLLSPAATTHLLDVMSQTVTGPNRLRAGLQPGWSLAHKTGTSGDWDGVTAATNDVGVLTAPDGRKIAITVFVADSHDNEKKREGAIAAIGRAAMLAYTHGPGKNGAGQ